MINYPLRSTESPLLLHAVLLHVWLLHRSVLCSLMAEDDCLKHMELPSDLYEENFAAY